MDININDISKKEFEKFIKNMNEIEFKKFVETVTKVYEKIKYPPLPDGFRYYYDGEWYTYKKPRKIILWQDENKKFRYFLENKK